MVNGLEVRKSGIGVFFQIGNEIAHLTDEDARVIAEHILSHAQQKDVVIEVDALRPYA